MSVLRDLAFSVRSDFRPIARVEATASTLEQLADVTPHADGAALKAGWRAAGRPRDDDAPAVSARRATCRELVETLNDGVDTRASTYADLGAAKSIWDAWFLHFAGSDDPRHRAMALTFARERKEFDGFVF